MGPGDILRAGAEGRYYARFYPDGLQAYVGMATRTAFGQPAVTALLWDGCVVTRLDADLAPEEMQEDVRLDLRPLEAQQERVFSSRGRWHAVGNVLVWGGVALLVCVVVTCNKRRRPGRVGRRWLAGILAVTLLGSVGVALSHRTVEVGPSLGFWEPFHRQDALSTAAACMAHDGYLHEGMTAEQFADLPQMMADRDYLTPEMFVNPFTGGRVRYERSPGNFFVRTFEGGEWLYVYDRRGIEIPVLELPPPPLRERVPDEAGPQDSLPQ